MAKTKKEKKPSELEIANNKIAELTETLQRLQAEFENYKKRVDKDTEQFRQYASAAVIEKLLPIVDTFELAIKNSEDHAKFKQGIELIYSQLKTMLKNEGLEKIEAKGQFNSNLHDAMMAVESDKDKDTILEVLQEGYTLKGKVLRHSKVKIAK